MNALNPPEIRECMRERHSIPKILLLASSLKILRFFLLNNMISKSNPIKNTTVRARQGV